MAKRRSKRPTRRPAKRALVRRRGTSSPATVAKHVEVLPASTTALDARTVQTGIQVGALGLAELKLTAEEESILRRPVPQAEIRIKPTAHAQPYLSHPTYTRWLNDAFGRTGWALVPAGTPTLDPAKRCVVQAYILHIHGIPVAYAMGEQEYHDGNKEQTYGDALEATVANALRRCAKRLGIGLEMWDRDYLDQWVAANCIRVKVRNADGTERRAWRRKIDVPFPFEQGRDDYGDPRDRAPREPAREGRRPAYGSHEQSDAPITDKQRKRLWVIIKNSRRDETLEVRPWLKRRYGIDSTKAIKRRDYEAICEAVESSADLPELDAPPAREPGEE